MKYYCFKCSWSLKMRRTTINVDCCCRSVESGVRELSSVIAEQISHWMMLIESLGASLRSLVVMIPVLAQGHTGRPSPVIVMVLGLALTHTTWRRCPVSQCLQIVDRNTKNNTGSSRGKSLQDYAHIWSDDQDKLHLNRKNIVRAAVSAVYDLIPLGEKPHSGKMSGCLQSTVTMLTKYCLQDSVIILFVKKQ